MVLLLLSMLLVCQPDCSTGNNYFDRYENIRIASGKLIERIEIPAGSIPNITCILQCQSNSECLMVAYESSNGSFCALWTFNGTVDYYPVYDETATLYTRRDFCPPNFIPMRPYWPRCFFFWTQSIGTYTVGVNICNQRNSQRAAYEEQGEFDAVANYIKGNPDLLKISRYLIGTKMVDSKHSWITNEKPLESWIWWNGVGTSKGYTSRMAATSYKVVYGFGVDYAGAGVICEWPKWGTMV